MREKLLEMLKRHEGLNLFPYRCTAGYLTIGYGRNIDARPLTGCTVAHLERYGISKQGASRLLDEDLDEVLTQLAQVTEWQALNETRQAVIADMAYNLGFGGLMRFKRMWDAIERQLWTLASKEMMDSQWARQVGARAIRLSTMMATGRWA